jgi:hypothetical protein
VTKKSVRAVHLCKQSVHQIRNCLRSAYIRLFQDASAPARKLDDDQLHCRGHFIKPITKNRDASSRIRETVKA